MATAKQRAGNGKIQFCVKLNHIVASIPVIYCIKLSALPFRVYSQNDGSFLMTQWLC